jgi:UDP-glucose 4-epimerase
MSSKPAPVYVAGGRGFIGRRVCAALLAAGRDPVAFGREGPPAGHGDLVWSAGGRTGDADALHEQHVAAPLRAVQRLRPARVVYLGSAEAYGRLPVPFRETDDPRPETPYGRAKRAGELALADACRELGAALIVLRPTVIYGPDQPPGMLLPNALAALRAGRPFPATAGEQTRDFLHVDDLAALVVRALAPDAPPGTYNAGTGDEVAVRDVLRLLAAAIGPEAPALLRLGEVAPRPGEAQRYAVDPTLARDRLGWRPTIALADGLAALSARRSAS